MEGRDVEFEESIITINGLNYFAYWTNHFSPYAMIEKSTEDDKTNANADIKKTSPATGNSDSVLISVLAVISGSALIIITIAYKRKRTLA